MTKSELEKQWDDILDIRIKDMYTDQTGLRALGFIDGMVYARANVTAIPEVAELIEAFENLLKETKELYHALNCAHGHIDPSLNKRTDDICYKALCKWENIRDSFEALNKLKGETKCKHSD